MADIDEFRAFFDRMGVVYREEGEDGDHSYGDRRISAGQSHFWFRMGRYTGVEWDEMIAFDPRREHGPAPKTRGGGGAPVLLFEWYRRDEMRARMNLPSDGLWNVDLPCGSSYIGFREEDRPGAEAEHLRFCGPCRRRFAESGGDGGLRL